MLNGRRILLGVTGGIAAYKTPQLVRLLVKAGAEVQVIMTESAKEFVSELVLSTVSKRPVLSSYVYQGEGASKTWNSHVELGLWPDLFLITPLTANTLAKMATGQADHLLLATYLSARCPVWVAPAMDLDMYQHPTTVRNLHLIEQDGVKVIPAESGELASGLSGQGRMPEPENLFALLEQHFSDGPLQGKRVLINAGPTYEAIDPVRFIGNHSSGKMGIALAEEALSLGAEVDLVLGPVNTEVTAHPLLHIHRVSSAEEMKVACENGFNNAAIAIMAAAVSDYRPTTIASQKIKKQEASLSIQLEPTPDILKGLGERKSHQFLVGFALETEHAEANGLLKLQKKNLDLIVVNQPSDQTGFGTETNQAVLLHRNGDRMPTNLVSKKELSRIIFHQIISALPHA